jgi:hypothetical protein
MQRDKPAHSAFYSVHSKKALNARFNISKAITRHIKKHESNIVRSVKQWSADVLASVECREVSAGRVSTTLLGLRHMCIFWGLFYDAVSMLHYIASKVSMIDELENIHKETVVALSRDCPWICLEGLSRST